MSTRQGNWLKNHPVPREEKVLARWISVGFGIILLILIFARC